MPTRYPARVRLTLHYQEPFAPVETEEELLREPMPTEVRFCRYAITLSELSTTRSSGRFCLYLEYPRVFIPYLIDAICTDLVQCLWFFIISPMKVQISAFKGGDYLGCLLPIPSYPPSPPNAEPLPEAAALLFSIEKSRFNARDIADQLAWPYREWHSFVVGVRNIGGTVNTQLLRAIQTRDYQMASETLYWLKYRPRTLQHLLNQEIEFLYTMHRVQGFGPFIYTAKPKEMLESAIREFLSQPLLTLDLIGGGSEGTKVEFEMIPLISFEYWRGCSRIVRE